MAMVKNTKTEEETTSISENKFTKDQIVNSKQFSDKRDIVDALLSNDKTYTINNVKNMIENYMKGQIK